MKGKKVHVSQDARQDLKSALKGRHAVTVNTRVKMMMAQS